MRAAAVYYMVTFGIDIAGAIITLCEPLAFRQVIGLAFISFVLLYHVVSDRISRQAYGAGLQYAAAIVANPERDTPAYRSDVLPDAMSSAN